MSDEIKVTVVATGLGGEAARVPLQVVDAPAQRQAESGSEPNYRDYERPTMMRRARGGAGQAAAAALEAGGEEYFDIPAFLRRQAD